jgi:hypothetical protein
MYYNMNNKLIRLAESDLHRIVEESMANVLAKTKWKKHGLEINVIMS